jgi:hypothetical protein
MFVVPVGLVSKETSQFSKLMLWVQVPYPTCGSLMVGLWLRLTVIDAVSSHACAHATALWRTLLRGCSHDLNKRSNHIKIFRMEN